MTTPDSSATSTPAGPSGVQGLGDTFAADPHSGTGRFTVPISLPAGHAGQAPALSLVYSSGAGAGVAGMGWSFGISSIRRRTDKGIPTYTSKDVFVLGDDELVPTGKGVFVRRQEGSFARIRKIDSRNGGFWAVTTRNGTRHLYGKSQSARDGSGHRVSSWRLSQTEDPNGNKIEYTYERDQQNHRAYLSQIDWGAGAWRVVLTYEARPDVLRDGRTGTQRVTEKRLHTVNVQVRRTDTGSFFTFDSYTFRYEQAPITGLSLLTTVDRTGTGPSGSTKAWPVLTMGYTAPSRAASQQAVHGAPGQSLDDPDVQLLDLDGNALPDLLLSHGEGYRLARNDGRGGFHSPVGIDGPTVSPRAPGVFFADLTGQGFPDLVTPEGRYDNLGAGFGRFQPFRERPSIDLDHPSVRVSDVTGNGRPDLMQWSASGLRVYENLGADGWGRPSLHAYPDQRFPRNLESMARLADLTGDGLADVARVFRTMVEVWDSQGNGNFGRLREVLLPEPLPTDVRPADVLFADVTGTGAADLVVRVDRAVWIFPNSTGELFLPPIKIRVHAIRGSESMRVVDLNGTGVPGLLFSGAGGHWKFYSLWNNQKPDVLKSVDNGMGATTTISYGSSVGHAQRDVEQGRRWRFPLPYPIQVVDEVTTVDSTTGFESGVRYRYHEGYHDPVEREYRGFAIVEQLDTSTLGSKTVSSSRVVTYFALGNGWRFQDRYTPVPTPTPSDAVVNHPDALRALRGRPIRVETFADDASMRAGLPYVVAHSAYTVRVVVEPRERINGSFYAVPRVSELFHLERFGEFRRVQTTSLFDDKARLIEQREKGFGRLGSFSTPHELQQTESLERLTRTTYLTRSLPEPDDYDTPYEPVYFLDAPHETTLVGVENGVETVLSLSRTYYDGPDFEGLGYPGNGTTLGVVRGRVSSSLVRRMDVAELAAAFPAGAGAVAALNDRGGLLTLEGAYWAHGARVKYASTGQVLTEKDPRGGQSTVDYDVALGLFPIGSVDAMGHPSTLQRGDLPFQVLSAVDPNGNTTFLTYDERNLLTSRAVAGKLSAVTWSGDSPQSPTETIAYDLSATPVHITTTQRQVRNGDVVTTHSYLDGMGRTLQERHQAEREAPAQPRWRVTGWQILDAKGNVVQAFQPSFSTKAWFDVTATDGPSERTDYDPLSRPVRVTHPDGSYDSLEYTPWSQVARDRLDNAVHAKLSGQPRYANHARWEEHNDTPVTTFYDAFGRAAALQEHNGFESVAGDDVPILHITRTVFNLRDEPVAVFDARNAALAAWTLSYDDAGSTLRTENHLGTGVRYALTDAAGNPIWTRDARGVETHSTFDALQRPLQVSSTDSGTTKLRRTWSYAVYNGPDHALNRSTNRYGPPTETRDADGSRIFTYDHRGLVLQTEARFWDHAWATTTDPMWAQGENWDPEISDDALANLTWMTFTDLAGAPSVLTTTATYDSAGRNITTTYPDGLATRRSYNEAGSLLQVELDRDDGAGFAVVAEDYTYDARGKTTYWKLGNGVTTLRTYDPELERVTRVLTSGSGGTFQDLNYTYDPMGNPSQIADALTNPTYASNEVIPNSRDFWYDARGRLIRATGRKLTTVTSSSVNPYAPSPAANQYEAYDFSYAYDEVGNFTSNGEYGGAVAYQTKPDLFAGNAAEAATISNYQYDSNGNATHTPRQLTIGYTFDSQPRFVDTGGAQVHDLRRGDQRCVRFGDKGATKTLSVQLGPWTYRKRTGTNSRTKTELQVSGSERHAQVDNLLAGTDATSVPIFFVHGDHLGSGHVLTAGDGTLLCQEEYLPSGRSSDRRSERNRYRFIGVERDEDTGLCMTGPRTYDPLTGRFLQPDPLVQPGQGPFVYASGNPVGRLDSGGYSDEALPAFDGPGDPPVGGDLPFKEHVKEKTKWDRAKKAYDDKVKQFNEQIRMRDRILARMAPKTAEKQSTSSGGLPSLPSLPEMPDIDWDYWLTPEQPVDTTPLRGGAGGVPVGSGKTRLSPDEFEDAAQEIFGGRKGRLPLSQTRAGGGKDVEIDLIADDVLTQIKRAGPKSKVGTQVIDQFHMTVDAAMKQDIDRIRYVLTEDTPAQFVQDLADLDLPPGMSLEFERISDWK